jgi:hypothetical protein
MNGLIAYCIKHGEEVYYKCKEHVKHFTNIPVLYLTHKVPYFLVGAGLIVGFMTIPTLLASAFMNLNFLLAGTVSTNPVLYTVAIILLFAGRGAYYWGADHWMIPYVKQIITQHGKKHKNEIVV